MALIGLLKAIGIQNKTIGFYLQNKILKRFMFNSFDTNELMNYEVL